MRLCRLGTLVRRANVQKQILDGVTNQYGSRTSLSSMHGVQLSRLIPSSIFERCFAEAVTAVANEHDAPQPGHSQKSSTEQASNTCNNHPERWSALAGNTQHTPVLLSEAIKALDFDWENESSEETCCGVRADSGKSASTSETGSGRGGGSSKKNTFRAPSEGGHLALQLSVHPTSCPP